MLEADAVGDSEARVLATVGKSVGNDSSATVGKSVEVGIIEVGIEVGIIEVGIEVGVPVSAAKVANGEAVLDGRNATSPDWPVRPNHVSQAVVGLQKRHNIKASMVMATPSAARLRRLRPNKGRRDVDPNGITRARLLGAG